MSIDFSRLIWNINIVGGEQNKESHLLMSLHLFG